MFGFTFSGTIYKVDFDKFTVSGGAVDMSVRRLAVNGSVNDTNRHTFVTKWDWYWQTEHLKWIPFNQVWHQLITMVPINFIMGVYRDLNIKVAFHTMAAWWMYSDVYKYGVFFYTPQFTPDSPLK